MNDRRVTTGFTSVWTVALVVILTVFSIIAVCFAMRQSLWTDEATQLSGLRLNFTDQLHWLAGGLPHIFAVPTDRMPPLSYWLGTLWMHAFGNGTLTARYLSICLSVASGFAVWAVARQHLDHRSAIICAALLTLSPNFVVMAAEIRAYSAFILFSTLLVYAYLRLLSVRPSPSKPDLWTFALAATLCSYTHYFGVVISAGALSCLLAYYIPVTTRMERMAILNKAKWPLCFYLLGSVCLIPFIIFAVSHSGGAIVSAPAAALPLNERFHDVVKLIYRTFGHQSMLGIPGLSVAAVVVGVTLMAIATMPGSAPVARQLMFLALANFCLIAPAGLVTSAFSAFSPTYNAWLLPVTALLAATTLTHANGTIRKISILCISVLIAADSYAALRLSTAGELYAHNRSSIVKQAVSRVGANNVIVVYFDDAPGIYFAMIYDYGAELRQYINEGSTVRFIGPDRQGASPTLCDLNAGTLIVAGDQELSAPALQFLIAHPDVHTHAYYALEEFLRSHQEDMAARWTLQSQNEYLSQSALALAVFKNRAVEESAQSSNCHTR